MTAEANQEVATVNPLLKAENFDELIEMAGGSVMRGADLIGDGFSLVQKQSLVGKPMIVIDWEILTDENSGRQFVTVRAIVKDNEPNGKVRFNDGSTGVFAEVQTLEEQGIQAGPIYFGGGLRRSDYVKEGVGDATTFYFAA